MYRSGAGNRFSALAIVKKKRRLSKSESVRSTAAKPIRTILLTIRRGRSEWFFRMQLTRLVPTEFLLDATPNGSRFRIGGLLSS